MKIDLNKIEEHLSRVETLLDGIVVRIRTERSASEEIEGELIEIQNLIDDIKRGDVDA